MGNKPRELSSFPEVLATWDHAKNPRHLVPDNLSRVDDERFPAGFWWVCPFGHSFPMSIKGRLKGSNCLVCSGKLVSGQNDLFTRFPQIRDFWPDPDSWHDRPTDVPVSDRVTVLMLHCPTHLLDFSIQVRSLVRYLERADSPCGNCRQTSKLSGRSIQETRPDLMAIWDMSLNDISPHLVSPGTKVRYWWTCFNGHDSWEASPYEVTNGWRMCPCCPGSHKVVKGCNDLATTHPEIAERWDFARNSAAPSELKIGTNKKFFFLCSNNPKHHPEMYLPNLKKNSFACTFCWNEAITCGVNDFACLFPELAPFFADSENKSDPHLVRPGDEREFTWKCLNGEDHTFKRTLATMTNKRSKRTCPVCVNRTIILGLNSLRDLAPDIADEWDHELNAQFPNLTPETISPRAGYEVFWKCRQGHASFKSAVWNRAVAETGCPNCANYGFKKGEAALLYFIERLDSEQFRGARKIGITNLASSKTRLRHWLYQGFTVIHTVSHPNGALISKLEDVLLKDWIRGEMGLGQYLSSDEILGGFTETFAPDFPSNSDVILKINDTFRDLAQT